MEKCEAHDNCYLGYLEMEVNNTERAKLYLFQPGHEIFLTYDEYPNDDKPKPIDISPENGYIWISLKMKANKEEWKVHKRYTGNLGALFYQ